MERFYFTLASSIFFVIFVGFLYTIFRPYKQRQFLKPVYVLTAGVFTSATILFIPIYANEINEVWIPGFSTFWAAIHNAIRLFVVDCSFSDIYVGVSTFDISMKTHYLVLFCGLFITAPLLTVGVVLSFFKTLSAYQHYIKGYFKDAYIFSELNERSISLAKSFKTNDSSRLIIFTDVYNSEDETSYELLEKAKELNAICFRKDITVVNFRFHSKTAKLYFFIMGENDAENINQTISLSKTYSTRKLFSRKKTLPSEESYSPAEDTDTIGYDYPRGDTRIYLFSEKFSSDQHLSAINPKYIKLRRVSNIQSLVYSILYKEGLDIFKSATPTGNKVFNIATGEEDDEKLISAVVIGMGLHGKEMVKALSWFTQMHPYRLEINAFDKNKDTASLFRSSCPELFDCNPADSNYVYDPSHHNGDFETPGEAHYKLSIHSDCDVELYEFDKIMNSLSKTTYVFVSLGDDDKNIKIATKVRILLKRLGIEPIIHTIVYNPKNEYMLRNGRTYANQSYNIIPLGDNSSTYSEECILKSELETKALDRHMEYSKKMAAQENLQGEELKEYLKKAEAPFWKYDYNYRSSIASVLHTEYKLKLKTPGSEKKPEERTENEKLFYRTMEHQRWNAYVRSEGYVYAPIRDKIANTHNLLIPFDELPYEEKIKDDN